MSNTHPWHLLLQSLLSTGSASCGRKRLNIHNGWLLPPALPTTVYCLICAARLGQMLALCLLPCTSVHRGKHYLERCTSAWKGAALARWLDRAKGAPACLFAGNARRDAADL